MKSIFLLLYFLLVLGIPVISQSGGVDSLLEAMENKSDQDLMLLYEVLDSMVLEKVPELDPALESFETLSRNRNSEINICRAQFLKAMYATKLSSDSVFSIAKAAEACLLSYQSDSENHEVGNMLIKVKLAQLQASQLSGDKELAVSIGYEVIEQIDSLQEVYADFRADEYRYKLYFFMSSLFLFDNDKVSTLYADSTIVAAKNTGHMDWLFNAYSLKYYTRYYNNDSHELDAIADTCIKYALIIENPKSLGEAYMHKCNAQVELKNIKSGMRYCDLADIQYQKLGDSSFLASTFHNMGNVFKKAKADDEALSFFQRALNFQSKKVPDQYFNTMEAVAGQLHEMGKFKESSDIYHSFATDYFTFYQEQLNSQFTEAEEKYQSEKKDEQLILKELQLENQKSQRKLLIYGGVLGLGMMLALFYGFYQRSKGRQKEDAFAIKMEKEKSVNLKQIAKSKTEFFNNISHELRTPLTLIIAPLKDIATKVRNVDVMRNVDIAIKNSNRLLSLTDEILELSQIDSGTLKLDLVKVRVEPFLSRLFYSFESLAASKQLQLSLKVDSALEIGIKADISKVEKILNNLISNAIKYSNKGGVVSMVLHSDKLTQNMLEVSIIDQGVGIPLDELHKIFDRYYQSSITPISSGTGIGLSFAQELAHFLGGEIKVESSVGVGSTFSLNLPIELCDLPLPETTVSEPQDLDILPYVNFGDKSPTVLIVEDNIDMSNYLTSLLDPYCITLTVADGLEALEVLATTKVDLISSDLMMPNMDGLTLKQKINENENLENVPFILLTARALENDILEGLQLGVDDYITKPFNADEYKARIFNLLKNKVNRQSVKENISYEQSLINKVTIIIQDNLSESEFRVSSLAQQVGYSPRQLNRIMKKATGMTPVEFILELRLNKAYQLITKRQYGTINEVRYNVGIESPSHFTTKFHQRFGIHPSEL